MKIIYVENARIPSERAHAYQTVQWCHWMGKLGHEVILVTPNRTREESVFNYYHLQERAFTHVLLPTFDALRYPWLPQRFAYVLQRWTFIRELRHWAKHQQADVWYTRSPAMVEALMKEGKRVWVLEAHDDPASNQRRWKRTRPHIKLFVAISEGMKKHLVACGINQHDIIVAHDGVDLEAVEQAPKGTLRQVLGIAEEAFLAVYTGGLYPWKGVDFVVEAWKETPEAAHLLLVGGPAQDRERIRSRIPTEARGRIHIADTMPREDIFSLLKEADIGLLPTSPDFPIGREFTSPLKLFEYLAAGLPILASDVPTSHEILNASVAKFFPQDAKAFIKTVTELIEGKAWRSGASLEARLLVRRYRWQDRAKRIANALKNLV